MKRFSLKYKRKGTTKTCEFKVDNEDACLVRGAVWTVHEDDFGNIYIRSSRGDSAGSTIPVILHRKIMNAKEGESVIFKNGNSLDMRKENMQVMSRSEHAKHANSLRGGKNASHRPSNP